ncbi:MAG: hypothetical protein ACRCWS_07090 [Propionibacteriaceae bacterium]
MSSFLFVLGLVLVLALGCSLVGAVKDKSPDRAERIVKGLVRMSYVGMFFAAWLWSEGKFSPMHLWVFALIVMLGILGLQLVLSRRSGPRSASLAPRRLLDLAPWWLWVWSGVSLGLAAMIFSQRPMAHRAWYGVALLVFIAIAGAALVLVQQRPAFGSTDEELRIDEVKRRDSAGEVLAVLVVVIGVLCTGITHWIDWAMLCNIVVMFLVVGYRTRLGQ